MWTHVIMTSWLTCSDARLPCRPQAALRGLLPVAQWAGLLRGGPGVAALEHNAGLYYVLHGKAHASFEPMLLAGGALLACLLLQGRTILLCQCKRSQPGHGPYP